MTNAIFREKGVGCDKGDNFEFHHITIYFTVTWSKVKFFSNNAITGKCILRNLASEIDNLMFSIWESKLYRFQNAGYCTTFSTIVILFFFLFEIINLLKSLLLLYLGINVNLLFNDWRWAWKKKVYLLWVVGRGGIWTTVDKVTAKGRCTSNSRQIIQQAWGEFLLLSIPTKP